jgi:hypothetical protein
MAQGYIILMRLCALEASDPWQGSLRPTPRSRTKARGATIGYLGMGYPRQGPQTTQWPIYQDPVEQISEAGQMIKSSSSVRYHNEGYTQITTLKCLDAPNRTKARGT